MLYPWELMGLHYNSNVAVYINGKQESCSYPTILTLWLQIHILTEQDNFVKGTGFTQKYVCMA